MNEETLFRIIFTLVFGVVVVIRLGFHAALGTGRENIAPRSERRLTAVLRGVLGVPLLLTIALSIIAPSWIAWASIPLPSWLRWAGVGLAAVAVPLLLWVHVTLGRHFSPTLRVNTQHQLVSVGPYCWVRHPMYSALLLLHCGYFLITANALIGLFGISVMLVVMVMRTPEEEALMLATFGDEYRSYMQQTGQFWPRWPMSGAETKAIGQ